MEEKREKKGIRCSYAVLVIVLFATLAFVTDYAYIERKTRKCDCSKCETTNNEVIGGNIEETDNTQVTENGYEDFADNIISGRQLILFDESSYRTTVEGSIVMSTRYDVQLSKSGELTVTYHSDSYSSDSRFIANNVLSYYVIRYGNGGFKGLYFIYEDGTVGFADIEYAYVKGKEITVEKKDDLNKIVSIVQGGFSDGMSGYSAPIYIDINGNLYK